MRSLLHLSDPKKNRYARIPSHNQGLTVYTVVCTSMVSRLHHVICEHMHAYRGCLFHPHFVVVHIIIIFNFVRKISAPLALKRLLPAISALNVCIHLPKYISMWGTDVRETISTAGNLSLHSNP